MSSNQMYLNLDSIFQFPVLPDRVNVQYGSNNDSIRVCGVGEVIVLQDSDAATISFSSFFPSTYFSGCAYIGIPSPNECVNAIINMRNLKKPPRFTITGGIGTSIYCSIESFETYEQGGDPGTIYYTLKLKEYREVTVRQITVNIQTKKARIASQSASARTDNTVQPKTHTVAGGDCLYNIAKRYYGNGALYTKIYNANQSVIGGNPNLIYPGQVLTIPA